MTQNTQVSAQVVKAEFNKTIWAVDRGAENIFTFSVYVPNSGLLEATDVKITATTLVDWEVISLEPAEFAVIVVDKSPYKRIRWSIPKLAPGESVLLTAMFTVKKSMGTIPIEVSVESPVSAPIKIGTHVEEFNFDLSLDENSSDQIIPSSWLTRLITWMRGVISGLAKRLNNMYDHFY